MPQNGEWVQPTPRGYKFICCDCGLIHRLDFRIIKYAKGKRCEVQFRAFRKSPACISVKTAYKLCTELYEKCSLEFINCDEMNAYRLALERIMQRIKKVSP